MKRSLAVVFSLALAACAHGPRARAPIAARDLPGTDGASHAIVPSGESRFTVLVFFARRCPCQAAHDARVRELYAAYHPRGVDFYAVDPEVDSSLADDTGEARTRAYPFPILSDANAAFARSVGAEYATETLVVDRAGAVRYRGAIDSDKRTLHDDATPYLREALDDLLADRPVQRPEREALGCALRTW